MIRLKCKKESCKANALKDADGYCYQHSQQVSVERTKARAEGGRHSKRHIKDITPIATIQDVQGLISDTLTELQQSKVDILPRSRAIGYLCAIMCDVFEKVDFEHRLCELEKKITN